jgi:hypothetical protein
LITLLGVGDGPGRRLEQGQCRDPFGSVDGELQRDQRPVRMPDHVGGGQPDVVHQPHADRGILAEGERTEAAGAVAGDTPAIPEGPEPGEMLDQWPVQRDERAGVDEHDRLAIAS